MNISKVLLLVAFLVATQLTIGQTDNKIKIIAQISPVFESGLVSNNRDTYLFISRSFEKDFQTDLFFASIGKMNFRKQSDFVDSISKDFKVYSIKFDSANKQIQQIIMERNNYGNSFLIPLVPEVSGAKAYLITLFAKQIESLQYQIVNSDCEMHWEDCEAKILNINFKL